MIKPLSEQIILLVGASTSLAIGMAHCFQQEGAKVSLATGTWSLPVAKVLPPSGSLLPGGYSDELNGEKAAALLLWVYRKFGRLDLVVALREELSVQPQAALYSFAAVALEVMKTKGTGVYVQLLMDKDAVPPSVPFRSCLQARLQRARWEHRIRRQVKGSGLRYYLGRCRLEALEKPSSVLKEEALERSITRQLSGLVAGSAEAATKGVIQFLQGHK